MMHNENLNQMPKLVRNLILTLKVQFPECSVNSITNIVLAKTAQVVTSKRVKYKEFKNTGLRTLFFIAINHAQCGSFELDFKQRIILQEF